MTLKAAALTPLSEASDPSWTFPSEYPTRNENLVFFQLNSPPTTVLDPSSNLIFLLDCLSHFPLKIVIQRAGILDSPWLLSPALSTSLTSTFSPAVVSVVQAFISFVPGLW